MYCQDPPTWCQFLGSFLFHLSYFRCSRLLVFNFISSLVADVSVIFNETDYSVLESEGLARVCVQMTGFSATPLMLLLTPTAGGSATGNGGKPLGQARVDCVLCHVDWITASWWALEHALFFLFSCILWESLP